VNLPGHSSLDLQDEQTDRETETDRQTDRQTDGRTDELQNALHTFLQDTKVCVKENGQLLLCVPHCLKQWTIQIN